MKKYSSSAQKVLGIGNALLDTLVCIPDDRMLASLGLQKGCMTLVDTSQNDRFADALSGFAKTEAMGGSAANAIRAIAALGHPCGYVGKVGEDAAGALFRQELLKRKISSELLTDSLPTGRCHSLVSPDGERTMATFLGASATLTSRDFSAKTFGGYHYLLIEGYLVQNHEMIEEAIRLAKANGLCVAMDLSSPNVVAAHLPFLRKIASMYVDIIFANEEEAMVFSETYSALHAVPVLSSYCKIAAIKLGCKGSIVAYQHTRYLIPAYPTEAKDTTGAGDLYAAGFLYGMVRGLGLETCGKIASMLASKVVSVIGACIPEAEWPALRRAVRKLSA